MKLSLAWIFDHLDADPKQIDVAELVARFNAATAEIEHFYPVHIDTASFACARVTTVDEETVTVDCPEWNKTFTLPFRNDASVGRLFVLKKDGDVRWADIKDFNGSKEGHLAALDIADNDVAGDWKKQLEADDYILELDNKSITHRPDMWGHRGFAREAAALLDLRFIDEDELLVDKAVEVYSDKAPSSATNPFTIKLKDQETGKRFAGLFIKEVEHRPSLPWMAVRLARVDTRPIDAIVDMTNYVMLDIGQPMHAFDAENLSTQEVVPRCAKKNEKLVLLDDTELTLTPDDYVITDGVQPIALAGIMGGKYSGISPTTSSLFLESANFDAAAIRRSSTRHKVRTEASMRFEKSLDPNQNVAGILRFLRLLDDAHIPYTAADVIDSVGQSAEILTIDVPHALLEDRIGTSIDSTFVIKTLGKIGFTVHPEGSGKDLVYVVTVPTYRSTKDVTVPEDIVEEVARFFGYENIEQKLPRLKQCPTPIDWVLRIRSIKQFFASTSSLREVHNYSMFDESFLRTINWQPEEALTLQNPVSENWQKMVTSLIPHLLKNVATNAADHDKLGFFEWARVWHQTGKRSCKEQKRVAGVWYQRKQPIDFYEIKEQVVALFDFLRMKVEWVPLDHRVDAWWHEHQTAVLLHDGEPIGYAGKVAPRLMYKVTEGDAFLLEINGDALLRYQAPTPRVKPSVKYQAVALDISALVPLHVTVQEMIDYVANADKRIVDVQLHDMFKKDEWEDRKSLTLRFLVQDTTKTLTKDEIDDALARVTKAVKKLGAEVR